MSDPTAFESATAAAAAGNVAELERLVAETPSLLAARSDAGYTLLALACKAATGGIALPPNPGTSEQHAAVDFLLAAGADPALTSADGWTPLHMAACTGHADLAQRLLAAGAPRTGRLLGTSGGSPLALGLFYAQAARIGQLLGSPPEPDNLRTAAALGRPLERFLDGDALTPAAAAGTDFYRPSTGFPAWERTNSRQELLDEALSWAARNEAIATMAALVELGANVNANPYRGTPLLWSVYADRVASARWLLDHGADPNLRHDFGGSTHGSAAVALHLAAQFSQLGCLRLLLERGADTTIEDAAYHATPLGWAEHFGCHEAAARIRAAR